MVIIMSSITAGCADSQKNGNSSRNFSTSKKWDKQKSWRANVGWKAEDFFDDPKVIALCNAVEEKDMETFDKLLTEGVDVNTRGKGNMTPLFWSFPDHRDEYFKKLLEHGADPNVIIDDNFGLPDVFSKGTSLTYNVASSDRTELFKWIMEHGGDPNQVNPGFDNVTPITAAVYGNRKDNIKILIQKNADLNYVADSLDSSAAMKCARQNSYELVLLMLESGAKYKLDRCGVGQNWNLVRILAERYDQWIANKSKIGEDYRKVVDWIKKDGFDVEKAKKSSVNGMSRR